MPNYQRGKQESATAWAARLQAVNAEGLPSEAINQLTACRVQAALAAKGSAKATGQAGSRTPLHHCQERVRALSEQDRLELLRWIENGMPE